MKKAEVKKEKKKNVLKEYWPLYLMMLPALLYLLINNYIPMAGMVIAFKKLNFAKGIWASPWAGLDNFKFLFSSKDAFGSLDVRPALSVVFCQTICSRFRRCCLKVEKLALVFLLIVRETFSHMKQNFFCKFPGVLVGHISA